MPADRATNPYTALVSVIGVFCACALLQTACGSSNGTSTRPSTPAKKPVDAAASKDRDAADDTTQDAGSSMHVSFARDVQPIFQRCVICHHPGGIVDYDLVDPFDPTHGIVGRANDWYGQGHKSTYELVVKPGSADQSFLIYKVSADPDPKTFDPDNNGDPMPLQVERVTADELANIKQWISDGAKNDSFFTGTVAPIFGTAVTLGSHEGKCTLCHYPNSSTGLNILAPFDSTVGLVSAHSILSTKPRVMPGSPENSFLIEKIEQTMPSAGSAMPLHYARLTNTEVDILREWIAQGAAND